MSAHNHDEVLMGSPRRHSSMYPGKATKTIVEPPLKVIPCGTIVKTKYGNIEGMITCISIKFDKVLYEVSYFLNGDQKTVWMNEPEFEPSIVQDKSTIGFK